MLKEIQTESGARVYLPTTKTAPARARAAGKDVITILGSQRACDIAQDLVLARAEDAENGRRSKEVIRPLRFVHSLGAFLTDFSRISRLHAILRAPCGII